MHLPGRKVEIAALTTAWQAACRGEGAAILIEGEPGIGKSRIVSEPSDAATEGPVTLLQCQPRTQGDALFSIIRMYDHGYVVDAD